MQRSERTSGQVLACLGAMLFVLLPVCAMAQSGASFTVKNSSTSFPNDTPLEVDLNGDGIPDLVATLTVSSTGIPASHAFSVQLGHGDGTFGAPTNYPPLVSNWTGQIDAGIATADFNNDGKADLVVPMIVSTGSGNFETDLQFYMGNGNGTLAPPVTTAVPGIVGQIAAADFNHDGNADLVVYDEISHVISFMAGDGHGNFAAPVAVATLTSNDLVSSFAVGDFDADANADVAYTENLCPCSSGFFQGSEVHFLYGNGMGGFTNQTVFSTTNADSLIDLTAGDLNDDGATDVVTALFDNSANNVIVVHGSKTRSPSVQLLSSGISNGSDSGQPRMILGDLNGDLHNDFGLWGDTSSGLPVVKLFLGNAAGGYKTQSISVSSGQGIGAFVTSDFDRNRKPDFGTLFFSEGATTTGTDTFKAFLDTTSGGHFAPCSFPASSHGLHACTPGVSSTVTWPVHFTASGTWFQQLRKAELWIDGTKVAEQHFGWDKSQWFDQTREVLPGAHKATFFVAGMDNRLQTTSVNFTVSGMQGCSHPSTVGIHVCSPKNSSIWGGGVLVQAAATVSGTPGHMELWIDGVKTFSQSGTTLVGGVNLKPGLHRFSYYAFNTAGTKVSATVSATTQ